MARSPIGSCGMYCGVCEIYIASTTSDDKRKASLAPKLSKSRGKKIAPDDVHCWGCWSNNRNCWGKRCQFRKCAASKGIDFCYQCNEFPCADLNRFYMDHPEARENLMQISKSGFDAYISKINSRGSGER